MFDLEGKILLVGNAESSLKEKRDLSEYKIVRMNYGFPKGKEEYIGEKTDFLATSMVISPEKIEKEYGDPFIFWMTPKETWAESQYKKFYEQNAFFYPYARWRVLKEGLGARPSTGAMTVDVFAGAFSCDVYILGFDWLETKTWYWNQDNRKRYKQMYNWKAEKDFIVNHKNVTLLGG